MPTIKQVAGTKSAVTVTGGATLAAATFVASDVITFATNDPVSGAIEIIVATTNTPSGNKQLLVFLSESLDNTNFRSGPTSGTTATREINLKPLGVVPITTASTTEVATFDIAEVLGYCPPYAKIVFKNDLGVALTSLTLNVSEISLPVA